MAGMRVGFVAGDAELDPTTSARPASTRGSSCRRRSRPRPTAALGDDEHVVAQRDRYEQRRELDARRARARTDSSTTAARRCFYLWLRAAESADDGWEIAARLAEAGTLVAPGSLYGPAGADHVRLALTQPDDRLELVLERLAESSRRA